MAPSNQFLKEKLESIISANPILKTYTRTGSRERLKKFPFKALWGAACRRIESRLVELGLLGFLIEVETFWGDRIIYPRLAARELKKYGTLEGDELFLTKFIIDSLEPGGVFIDGGANVGWYTLLASKIAGAEGLVCGFEPTPRVFEILKRNTAGKKNVILVNQALLEERRKMIFHDFGSRRDVANTFLEEKEIPHGDLLFRTKTDIEVQATTIDEYCFPRGIKPTFIKLDVEGSELKALSGASEVLKKYRPIVTAEAWSGRGLLGPLAAYMEKLNYNPYEITQNGAQRINFNLSQFDSPRGASEDFDQKNIAFIPQ